MAATYPIVPGVRFKELPGHPLYCVGDDGSVWSKQKRAPKADPRNNGWRMLKPAMVNGYPHVGIFSDRSVLIANHRLVLLAFVGPRPHGMQCCHCDGNKANNRLDNLRYDTPAGNNADKVRHGTWQGGAANGNAKLTEDDVRAIRRRHADGESRVALALHFGVTTTMIRFIVTGKSWRHVEPIHDYHGTEGAA